MESWPDSWLAVLVVLVFHENKRTRKSYPSQDLISLEAGIGKAGLAPAIKGLEENGWIAVERRPAQKGRTRNEYRMKYRKYAEHADPEEWFGINSSVVANGVWAIMPKSVKRLFLILRAISWDGSMGGIAVDNWGEEWLEREHWNHERFVDATHLDSENLSYLTGLNDRTLRRAKKWLFDNKIIVPNDGEYADYPEDYREGLMMPDIRTFYAPAVRERLERFQHQKAKVMPGVKSSLSRMKRTKRGPSVLAQGKVSLPSENKEENLHMDKISHSLRSKQLTFADITEPEPFF